MKIFLLLLTVTALAHARPLTQHERVHHDNGIRAVMRDVREKKLRSRIDLVLTDIIKHSADELEKKGQHQFAVSLVHDWENTYREILYEPTDRFDAFENSYNIGDHPELYLSMWLARQYYKIEYYLGRDFCVLSHIADILTINATFRVVFHPATFPMDGVPGDRCTEYKRHFAGKPNEGEVYMGLVPVLVYWTVTGTLAPIPVVGWIGGFVAGVAEDYVARNPAPRWSDSICKRAVLTGNDNVI